MSTTVGAVKTLFNTYIGDDTNDRLSETKKYNFITEATSWLLEELGNEHMMATYELNYFDTIHKYKITAEVADLLVGADLRREEDLQFESFTRKSPREIVEDIAQNSTESSWAVDRHDDDSYLVINHASTYINAGVTSLDSLSEGSGDWTADATTDALNLTIDTYEFKEGNASLNFDLDVSQGAGNIATIYNPAMTEKDFSAVEELGTFLLWVYIPEAANTNSVSLTWGSDVGATPTTISNYWTSVQTTDHQGNSFVNGWNRLKFVWSDSTMVGAPDASATVYFQFDISYEVAQVDDTDYRFDALSMVRPEELTFHYISWNVGKDNGGTALSMYTADTDVPFYSGSYDQYKHVVAHKAASIAFYSALRLRTEGEQEESSATKALDRYRKNFESSKVRESKNFKVKGVNLRLRRGPRRRFN